MLRNARGPKPMILADVEPNGPLAEPPLSAPTFNVAQDVAVEPLLGETEPVPSIAITPRADAVQSPVPHAESKPVVQHNTRKSVMPSRQARAEAQPQLNFEERNAPAYETPPLSLLT